MIGLQLVAGAFVVAVLAWVYYQVVKAPENRPLRAVALCLTCAALAFPCGLVPVAERVDRLPWLGRGASELLQNALLLCTVYWLMCFYLFSAADDRQGRIRARWEALPLAVAVAVITVATVATADEPGERSYQAVDMQITGFAVFYLVAGGYLVYALATALRWTIPYARASRRPLATGLWLVASAQAGMVLGGSVRCVVVVIRWAGGQAPAALTTTASLLVGCSIPLFVVGVALPGVSARLVALRIWWQHRQTYHRLRPLWQLLHEAYPQDALTRVPTGRWRDRLLLRGVHRRYYRRIIECRDGLVRISPHLARLAAEEGERGAGDGDEQRALAARLRAALKAQAAGGEASSQAVPIAIPESDSLEADAEQLVALSDALRSL